MVILVLNVQPRLARSTPHYHTHTPFHLAFDDPTDSSRVGQYQGMGRVGDNAPSYVHIYYFSNSNFVPLICFLYIFILPINDRENR